MPTWYLPTDKKNSHLADHLYLTSFIFIYIQHKSQGTYFVFMTNNSCLPSTLQKMLLFLKSHSYYFFVFTILNNLIKIFFISYTILQYYIFQCFNLWAFIAACCFHLILSTWAVINRPQRTFTNAYVRVPRSFCFYLFGVLGIYSFLFSLF